MSRKEKDEQEMKERLATFGIHESRWYDLPLVILLLTGFYGWILYWIVYWTMRFLRIW